MNSTKRMVGEYEIRNSMKLGGKEFVIGENMSATDGNFYLTAECSNNGILESYENCLISPDYLEIVEIYNNRLSEQIAALQSNYHDNTLITENMCTLDNYENAIKDEIVVVKASVLSPEYRNSENQIIIPVGGFGSEANSNGRAVFAKNLYTSQEERWNREDIIGVLKPEYYPDWVIAKLQDEHINDVSEDMEL